MLKTILERYLIEDGERLVRKLAQERFPISAALWYHVPERITWKLIIATQLADQTGPLDAYRRIGRALTKKSSIALDDVLVMSPQSRQFQDLRRTIEGAAHVSVSGRALTPQGVLFEDAYVYRWPVG